MRQAQIQLLYRIDSLKKQRLARLYHLTLGDVKAACKRSKNSRETFYRWYRQDKHFRAFVDYTKDLALQKREEPTESDSIKKEFLHPLRNEFSESLENDKSDSLKTYDITKSYDENFANSQPHQQIEPQNEPQLRPQVIYFSIEEPHYAARNPHYKIGQ